MERDCNQMSGRGRKVPSQERERHFLDDLFCQLQILGGSV
jgi:hypothetical protein